MKSKIQSKHLIIAFIATVILVTAVYAGFSKPREADAAFTVKVSEAGATITTTDVKKDQKTVGGRGFITVGFTVSVGKPTATHGGGSNIYWNNNYAYSYFPMTSTATGNDFTYWGDVPAGSNYTTTYKMSKAAVDAVLADAGFTWEQFQAGECTLVFDAIVVSTTNQMRYSTVPPHVSSEQDDRSWRSRPDPKALSTRYYRWRNQNNYHNGIPGLISWGDEEDHFEIVVSNTKMEAGSPAARPVSPSYPVRFISEVEDPRPWETPSGVGPMAGAKPDLLATYNWDRDNYYHVGNTPSEDISTDGIPSSSAVRETALHNGVMICPGHIKYREDT